MKRFNTGLSILVLSLLLVSSCKQNSTEKVYFYKSADSLLKVVENDQTQLKILLSDSVAILISRLETHRLSGKWDSNTAALRSIGSASQFLKNLAQPMKELNAQLMHQKEEITQLKEQLELKTLDLQLIRQKLLTAEASCNILKEQVNYASSRYHAHLMLAQTLDKALVK